MSIFNALFCSYLKYQRWKHFMISILNKFNTVLSKHNPFYIQSLSKDVNHILLSYLGSMSFNSGREWDKTSMQQALITACQRCMGMNLAHSMKESFQVFFSDVYFGSKDFLLIHLQTIWLAEKILLFTLHTTFFIIRILICKMDNVW